MSTFKRRMVTAHVLRIFLAATFLGAAVAKSADADSFNRYFSALWPLSSLSATSVWAVQWSLVFSEATIGLLLLMGLGVRAVSYYAAVMLLLFTVLVAPHYAEKQCGCGWIANWLTPEGTLGFIARNVVLVALAFWVGVNWKEDDSVSPVAALISIAGVALFCLAGLALETDPSIPIRSGVVSAEVSSSSSTRGEGLPTAQDSDLAGELPNRLALHSEPDGDVYVRAFEEGGGPSGLLIVGCVRDLDGLAVQGAVIINAKHPDAPVAVAGKDGRFMLTAPMAPLTLSATKEGLKTVLEYTVSGSTGDQRPTILMAKEFSMSGSVSSLEGGPIPGARLWLAPRMRTSELGHDELAIGQFAKFVCRKDERGEFRFDRVACAPEFFSLGVQAKGFVEQRRELPTADSAAMEIQMERISGVGHIIGRVLHKDGASAGGATVCFGENNRVISDAWGRFDLQLETRPSSLKLTALLDGFQPGTAVVDDVMIEGQEGVLLYLGAHSLSITGRVVSPTGEGVKGLGIGVTNGLELTHLSLPPRFAEQFATKGGRFFSSSDGAFEVSGLRSGVYYELYVHNAQTGETLLVPPALAGTQGLVVEIPDGGVLPRFEGRITSLSGVGLGGLLVSATVGLETSQGTWELSSVAQTATNPDGSFRLDSLPRRLCRLNVSGDSLFMPAGFSLERLINEDRTDLVVQARCTMIILTLEDRYDTLHVLDEDGERWPIGLIGGYSAPDLTLQRGKTDHVFFPECARTIVLLHDAVEVERREVDIQFGADNILEL